MSQPQKILIVDDERFNVNVLVDLLKPNYKIMVAINGQQAIKAAHSSVPPDLILLDIMMPEMDGYEVCQQLKSDPSTKDIPIIFVTAMGQQQDETKGLELGASDYLTKPIVPAIVEARVKTQLALKHTLEELRSAYKLIESQKKRMQTELDVGRDIQLAMVPKIFPQSDDYSVFAILEPAREVGGDFFDVFHIDEERICLVIGDVSGKGVPAALFMAMAKTLIKSRASTDSSTASIVTHVNDELSTDNDGYLFVTLYLCILNTQTGELLTTNAGHNPPLIRTTSGEITALSRLDGPVVAAVEGIAYKEGIFQLNKGDSLLMFTDGVTEADAIDGKFFGDPRLKKIFSTRENVSTKKFVLGLLQQVHDFEGEERQADDITILALDFFGLDLTERKKELELKIKNKLSDIDLVTESFMDFSLSSDIPKQIKGTVCMALDDLLTNIINYAYTDESEHEISIKVSIIDNAVVTVISDEGIPFNPFQQLSPNTDASIDEREIGRLGVYLVKQMFDQVYYQRNIGRNVVTLVKNIREAK